MTRKYEMSEEQKYSDLDNLISNLQNAIEETELEDFKQDLKHLLSSAEEQFKEITEEKEKEITKEYKEQIREREREYRSMVL